LFGSVWLDSCEVILEKALEPVPSKFRVTIQPLPCVVSNPELALLTFLPSTAETPRMYFSVPSWLQATILSVGLAFRLTFARASASEQSSAVNFAPRASGIVVSSVPVLAVALADGDAVAAAAEAEADGLAEAAAESAFRPSVTARPCLVELAEAEAEEEAVAEAFEEAEADGEAEPDALAEGDAEAAGVLAVMASTGRKYSWAVVPTCCSACLEFVPLGMLTMMLSLPWV
jgi:hypothetical protein